MRPLPTILAAFLLATLFAATLAAQSDDPMRPGAGMAEDDPMSAGPPEAGPSEAAAPAPAQGEGAGESGRAGGPMESHEPVSGVPLAREGLVDWETIVHRDLDAFDIQEIILAYATWVDPETLNHPEGTNRRWVQEELIRHTVAAQAVVDGSRDPREAVDRLNGYFFSRSNFAYKRDESLDYVLPHKVLERRMGNDLGLGVIYLAVAGRLSFPWGQDGRPILALAPRRERLAGVRGDTRVGIWGAWAPGHFFLRLVGPDYRRNIEMSAHGEERQDSAYLEAYDITARQVEEGLYLGTIGNKELAGLLAYARGNEEHAKDHHDQAAIFYGAATELNPTLINAYIRRGDALYRSGRLAEAMPLFDRALHLVPRFPEALRVRGLIFAEMRRDEEALRDLGDFAQVRFGPHEGWGKPSDRAAAIRKEDLEALKVRARLLERERMLGEARADWERVRRYTEDDAEARMAELRLREVQAIEFLDVLRNPAATEVARFQAASALGELRVHTAVPALIERLEDDNIRFRWHCQRILVGLTGYEEGPDKARWERWWVSNRNALEKKLAGQ